MAKENIHITRMVIEIPEDWEPTGPYKGFDLGFPASRVWGEHTGTVLRWLHEVVRSRRWAQTRELTNEMVLALDTLSSDEAEDWDATLRGRSTDDLILLRDAIEDIIWSQSHGRYELQMWLYQSVLNVIKERQEDVARSAFSEYNDRRRARIGGGCTSSTTTNGAQQKSE